MLARRRWEIANYQKSICNRPMLTHRHSDIKEPLVLQQTQENLCVADMWKIMRQSILRKSLWTKFERICLFFVCFFFSPKSCLPTGKTIRNHVEETALEVGQQWDWIWYQEIVANAILIPNIDMRMEFATIKSNHSRRAWPTFHSDGKSDVRLRLRFQHDL